MSQILIVCWLKSLLYSASFAKFQQRICDRQERQNREAIFFMKGLCGPDTGQKLKDFKQLLKLHMVICQNIYNKHSGKNWLNNEYVYVDAFGGPGRYRNDTTGELHCGSPVIFHELASQLPLKKYNYFVYEKDYQSWQSLTTNIGTHNVFNQSCSDLITRMLPIKKSGQFGMLFLDPPMTNETITLSGEIIKFFAMHYHMIDIVFYVGAGWIKRQQGANNLHFELDNLIKPIKGSKPYQKDNWAIRELHTSLHYTFLIGSNKIDWGKWKKAGFHNINDPQGKKIYDHANGQVLKKKKYKQPLLFPM